MKLFFSLLFLCIAFTTKPANAAPTEKETIDWLNSKLNGYIWLMRSPGDEHPLEVRVVSFRIEGNTMSYQMSMRTKGTSEAADVSTFSIPIHGLSSQVDCFEIPNQTPPGTTKINLYSKDGKMYPFMIDPDLGPRIGKAFQYLLRNNGKVEKGNGKAANEPF